MPAIASVDTAKLCLKLRVVFLNFCPCRDFFLLLTEEEFQRGNRIGKLDELQRQNFREKGANITEMYDCGYWSLYKTDSSVMEHLGDSQAYKMRIREKKL